MIRKLDEITTELRTLIGYIEESELQYLKVYDNKYWVDEACNILYKIEEVREFLNDVKSEL